MNDNKSGYVKTFIDRMFELPEAQMACIYEHFNKGEDLIIELPVAKNDFKEAAEKYGYVLSVSAETQSGYYHLYIIAPSITRSELISQKDK